MSANITVYRYISSQCPDEAIAFLNGEGYNVPNIKTEEQLATLLGQYVDMEGEDGLERMMSELHPDRDMFATKKVSSAAPIDAQARVQNYMNASGCGCGHSNASGCACGGCSNFSGKQHYGFNSDESARTIKLIVTGSLILGGLALVLWAVKQKIV